MSQQRGDAAMTRVTTKVMMTTALLLALSVTGTRAQDPVRIAVSPAHAFAPAFLRIRVRVEPNAGNRALTIMANSEGYYRSSLIQLEGETNARTFFVEFKEVPAGEYKLSAVVSNRSGENVAVATQGVSILSIREP
jgi:hypothetical protein